MTYCHRTPFLQVYIEPLMPRGSYEQIGSYKPVFILLGIQKLIQEYDFLSFLNNDMDGFGT